MEQINLPHVINLRNHESADLHITIQPLITEYAFPLIENRLPPYAAAVTAVADAMRQTLADAITLDIQSLDLRRDRLRTLLIRANRYYLTSPDAATLNAARAIQTKLKAAEQGDARAQFNLGVCYENGTGVDKDASEAVKWYRKAAEQGHTRAQCNLGWCYMNGVGVAKDAAEAVRWYRKAAEQGEAVAQYNLGECYENGAGIPRDTVKAVKWYIMADEQGLESAREKLKALIIR